MPTLWSRRHSTTSHGITAHIINEPVDEEFLYESRLKYFHPTQAGDVLDGRFKTIAKLGFGAGSTVWLAENLKFIKIPTLDSNAPGESKRSKLISSTNPSHPGLSFIRLPIDEFQLKGPQGTHFCLVYEPTRETLYHWQRRLPRQRLPLPLFKSYAFLILQALDYLHTECHLIHTAKGLDYIKDDNILVTIENDSVLADFVKNYTTNPQPRHVRTEDGRVIYLSQDDFGPLRDNMVLLGCPWSHSVDIWNFGLVMWNLLENTSLFESIVGDDGEYDAHVHLAQIISLLGEPPETLVNRERVYRKLKLVRTIENPMGKWHETMNEYWGGPFFDENGQVLRKDLAVQTRKPGDTITELTGDEKYVFLDFASSMLQWLPEKRKTAKELLQHTFCDSLEKERERYFHSQA
ncbi:kinase-like domain-containing protein [Fusarium redolens]|uniref:non-specific serine/threonine protein kinase n=1 Tax=Fusarium redolens TaxID=48865 RepID=A0A9P9HR19_FUSRE|nr:kinase-like domain-containing protein [Fusarium redolens]KAH7260964.1 kinase-like domain-containing protein [Fusarium redolens]